ncbi:MAG: hypothetical protein QXK93_08860 [Candidatus Bathyarchaeia archaeon]
MAEIGLNLGSFAPLDAGGTHPRDKRHYRYMSEPKNNSIVSSHFVKHDLVFR